MANNGLFDFMNTPAGIGLLSAVASGFANARRGTPFNNIGRGVAGGLMGYSSAKDAIAQEQENAFNQQFKQFQMDKMKREMEREQATQAWQAGLPEALKKTKEVKTPFQADDAFNEGIGNGLFNAEQVPDMQARQDYLMRPESPYAGKLIEQQLFPKAADVKEVNGRLVQIGPEGAKEIYAAPEKIDYNKPFLPDGSPNPGYQKYELDKAARGAARMSQNNFGEPKPYWNPKTQRFEFYQFNREGDLRAAALPEGVQPADEGKLPEAQTKQLVGVQNLQNAITEYQNSLKTWNKTDVVSPDARAQMGLKYNNMMLQAKEAYNLGVLNGPDYDILTSVVTDPRTFMGTVTSNEALDKQAAELSRIMGNVGKTVSAKKRPQEGGGDVKPAAQKAQPMPSKPSKMTLKKGVVYNTGKGPLRWNGEQFEDVE